MLRLPCAVALPFIIAGIVDVTGAQAASLRVGDTVQIVHDVEGLQFGDQAWDSKAEGDHVYENEFIRTKVESQARILLVDRTGLSVGPISTIRIDRVLFNSDQSVKTVVVSADTGAVRWTSGDSSAYLIRTPTANVTPIGTVFDLFVDSQRTFVILRQGRVRVCTNNQQPTCKTLANPGEMILATADDLQGPGGGGPEPADFANRCLSATGQDCTMNLTYAPPPAPQRDQAPHREPPVSSKPKRADIQPRRPTVVDEQPSRPRVVEEPRPRVVVEEYVVPRPRVVYPPYYRPYRPYPPCFRCAYANYGAGNVRYPPTRTIYPPGRRVIYGGYGGRGVNSGASVNPGSVLH
jgi:Tfp pilus assembly protein FimT